MGEWIINNKRGVGVELKLQNFGLTTTAPCDLYIFIIKLYFNLVRSFFFPSCSPVITYPTFLVTRGKGASCQNWKQEVMKLTRISIKITNLRLQPAGSFVTVTNNLQNNAQGPVVSEWLHFLAFINFTKTQFHWLSFSLCWLLRRQHHVWWEAKPLVRWFLFLLGF